MLDLKFIRDNQEIVKKAIAHKRVNLDLDNLLSKDRQLVALKQQVQELQEKRNAHSKKIPKASAAERPALIEEGRNIGLELDSMKPKLTALESELQELMWLVPMIPSSEAPIGKDDSENVVVKKAGKLPQFDYTPLDHVQILEKNNWAEFIKVGKVCGSRSYSLRNEMVLLELATHRLALDILMKKGFTLASFPAFVREEALYGTGHFPTGRDQVYHLPNEDLYLSGTAEVQANSMHSGELMAENQLPILYAGYSPCFRSEAGSYGKDVRGLIRVHQFMKVEQYIICKNDPEEAKKWHKILLETSEEIVNALELPYQIVEVCTGDMGAGKVRMYDVECWVPSEQKYRETHSCSSLHDWQARRSDLRYRNAEGKVEYCFTLNNTAIATPRILVSLLECHQRADGKLNVPEKLRPYLSGREVL